MFEDSNLKEVAAFEGRSEWLLSYVLLLAPSGDNVLDDDKRCSSTFLDSRRPVQFSTVPDHQGSLDPIAMLLQN